MNETFNAWLARKGFITTGEHDRLIRIKNDTIQAAFHLCLEQERELNALRKIVARKLTGEA